MNWLASIPIIGDILKTLLKVVDKAVPDKDLAEKIKKEIQLEAMEHDFSMLEKEIESKAKVLTAEIQGESWLQKNWRPILMISIVAIVVNNYILYPYLSLFTSNVVVLSLPDAMWNLMQIGVGGYIVGRSGEKIVKSLKGGTQ